MWSKEAAEDLRARIKDTDVKVACGMEGLIEAATLPEAEVLVTAIVGMIGIRPTIAAINAGKTIALANKETLVCAGHIIMPLIKEKRCHCFPWTASTAPSSSPCRDSRRKDWQRFY